MITDARFIPGTQGVYALSSSGTQSVFHVTSNPFAAPVVWNDTELENTFTRIVPEINGLNTYVQGVTDQTPGGCADGWEIAFGTEISRTPNSITASSTNAGGAENVIFCVSGEGGGPFPIDDLSRRAIPVIISGSSAAIGGWFYPGDTYPGDEHTGPYGGQCIRWGHVLIAAASGPFTVEITLTDELGCGDCGMSGGDVITDYSTDSGTSFDPIKIVGVMPSVGYTGMDTIKIGTTALVGAGSQVFKATSGGDWSVYSGTLPSGAQPNALYLGRWAFGGTVTPNTNTSSPQYLLGSGTISASGETVWKVTNAGSLFTAISPKIGTLAGEIVSPDALKMPWNSGTTITAIARFGADVKFCVSVNTGATWHFTSLDDNASEIAMRRGDLQVKQAVISNYAEGGYIPNYRGGTVNNYDRFFPGSSQVSIDVYG